MRCVGGVVAAGFLLAAGSFVGVDSAVAFDGPGGSDLDRYLLFDASEQHTARFLLFSGFDLWRNGGSAHGGLLWSPGGLAREGFTLKLLVAGGLYRYNSAGTTVTGHYALTSAMAGWRFKGNGLDVTLFAGPDFQTHKLTPDDLGNKLRGDQIGARFGGDVWYQPNAAFMTTVSVSFSTIGLNYWTRAAGGWHALGLLWIGPEVLALGGGRYHQVRAGLHVTGLRTWMFEWSGGFGYVRDSDNRDGLYGRFGLLTKL
jgi:hypothetical protein